MATKQPKHRPRWHCTKFGLLLPGYYFKASRNQQTWWVKRDGTTATSENGQVKTAWLFDDMVWVDISTSFIRRKLISAGDADCPA